MAKEIVLIRHGRDPADDRVSVWLQQHGVAARTVCPFDGETIGDMTDDVAGTVVYGGKYNVYETDRGAFLLEEYCWIDACLNAGLPVLGLCQGAQQIAHHLGAWAGPPKRERHEFGYYEIEPVSGSGDILPGPLTVTQAHFHTFDIPEGSAHLARSEAFENQAFRMGDKVFGFQFHPEQTVEGFRRWQNADWAAWGKPGVQTRDEQNRLMAEHDETQARWFYSFLDRLFGHISSKSNA
ncbi:MAG: type 1 glutamine amidotransferase [Rhizobiaceae bacterium]